MELELDLELDRKQIGFLLFGTLLGIGLTLGYTNLSQNSSQASNQLEDFLENQSGQELEVVNSESAGQYHRVDIRTEDDQVTTYYTDGKRFTSQMQSTGDIQERNTALTEFSQCLQDSETVMFGNTTQQATQAQIQALGGTQVVAPIYQDVSNNQTLQQVAQLGITQVPAFYRNQSAIQGTQTLQQVEQFTTCDYRLN
jgi:hypothetical protein